MLYFTDVNTTLLKGEQEKLFDEDAFGFFFFFLQKKENEQPKYIFKNIIHNNKEFFILNS
jgi:hypothetical protein